jgi:DNA mismatch repair protein MutL
LYFFVEILAWVVVVYLHAAHEVVVLVGPELARADGPVPSQALLVPEVVELGPAETERVLASSEALAQLGLVVEGFGPGALLVRETPAALGTCDAQALLRDVADGLAEWGAALPLSERLDRLAGTFACHHSIRAGRRLKPEEMNALLRQIEAEPAAAQCNHGRPTYVTLSRTDLERLFHRR